MTYNIWFDNKDRISRLESLIAVISINNPDIICIQEAVPDIYELLKLKLEEYKHHFPKVLDRAYGSVILSKIPFIDTNKYEFETSKMGRYLLTVTIKHEKLLITIGNSHFESEFSKKYNKEKMKQYTTSEQILDKKYNVSKDVIFASDTNIQFHEEDKFFCKKEWKDSWIEKGNNKDKYTFDYYTNKNLKSKSIGKFRSRLDRILYRSDGMNCINYKLIKGVIGLIQPSDHHGVLVTFAVK